MHARGVLHRDIQLGNCVIGLPPNEKVVYMIDFGFSKQYVDSTTRQHIPDSRAKRDFIGNYWFSSVRVHCKGRGTSQLRPFRSVVSMLSMTGVRSAFPPGRLGSGRAHADSPADAEGTQLDAKRCA